jgi:RNA methyltransferase, TrmH family
MPPTPGAPEPPPSLDPPQSLSQARAKLIGRLGTRRTREREGLVLVEGPRAIETALACGARFRFAVVASGPPAAPTQLESALAEAGVEIATIDPGSFASLADTETPQGILAVVEEPRATMEALDPALDPARITAPILVLDRVQDPGNVGTLLRAAAGFGAPGVVVLDGTVDPWNPKVVRASAGEAFRLPVVRTDWPAFDRWRRERNVLLRVADAGGLDVRRFPVATADASRPHALLIANEGAGPRPEALAAADTILALPLAPGVESLNAAMAGSVLLWALGPGAANPNPSSP